MARESSEQRPLAGLGAFDERDGTLNAVIETPRGSRNKFKYEPALGLFKLSGVLPAGAEFPYDFGFVPSTQGGDGDPLDVLVLMDQSAFAGCLVPARLIGVIEAEQTEEQRRERNDRLIAVAADSHTHRDVSSLDQVSAPLLDEIEHFFRSYNAIKGKQFQPLGRFGPDRARRLVEEGVARFAKQGRARER